MKVRGEYCDCVGKFFVRPSPLYTFLADELWVYVLGFLFCRDIFCCTSVSKGLHQIYMSSSELQLIVALSGQCLLPGISSTDDRTPIFKRLQRLRDKAHAWLEIDAYAFQTAIPSISVTAMQKYVTGATLDYGRVHPHAAGPVLVLESPVVLWEAYRFIASILHSWSWDAFHHVAAANLGLAALDNIKRYARNATIPGMFPVAFPVGGHRTLPSGYAWLKAADASSVGVYLKLYTLNSEHTLLCLTSSIGKPMICLISTKVFFDIDETTAITLIPWNYRGPGHVRIFEQKVAHVSMITHVSGNRVLLADQMMSERHEYYKLHMIDFSPLAVTNRRGLGRVVKERSTVTVAVHRGSNFEWDDEAKCYHYSTVETALPYVEVISDGR
ncbi:hypothetical protein BDR06DRAFT_1068967 [Suillus hirtellus]|nr:hypothetical protein BDR06DRAFT_1068967 [Suillus hirtellus]